MILQLSKRPQKTIKFQKNSWDMQLKQNIYRKNLKKIKNRQPIKINSQTEQKIHKIIQIVNSKQQPIIDNQIKQLPHSCYSSYIPVSSNEQFQDQLIQTFPYIRKLKQKNCMNQKHIFYHKIQSQLTMGQHFKSQSQLLKNRTRGFQLLKKCLKTYLPYLDRIQAINIYLEILKKGTQILKKLQLKYNPQCRYQIFFDKVCQSQRYFKPKLLAINKMVSISIENLDQINGMTMSKTMKSLFCSVCLKYDCGKHKLDDDIVQNAYQYTNPTNKMTKYQQIMNGIKICKFYQTIFHQNLIKQQNLQQKYCSEDCYLQLNKQTYSQVMRKNRARLINPIIKGLIYIGVEMFSYNPCKISHLFSNNKNKISCSLIFGYFFQQYHLDKRLTYKLYQNQYQYLLNQPIYQIAQIQPVIIKPRKKITSDQKFTAKCIQISNCYHYFLNKDPIDILCDQCSCVKRGFCLQQCLCSPGCPIRRKGCTCKGGRDQCKTKKCQCYNDNIECQPGICLNCFSSQKQDKKNICSNDSILRRHHKLVRVGKSDIPNAGLGAFASEDIQKDSLVLEYSGEIIQAEIDAVRQVYRKDMSFYNFDYRDGSIDARYIGNKARFINHGNQGQANLRAQYMYSKATVKIVLFAQRDVMKGQQLLFNYDGQGKLFKNYSHQYPYIKPKKQRQKI